MEKEKTVTSSIRFPESLWKYVKKICVEQRISFGDYVIDAIKEKLRRENANNEHRDTK